MAADDRAREHESMVQPRLEAYAPVLGPREAIPPAPWVTQVDYPPEWALSNSFTCDSQTRTRSHHHYLTQGATR